MKERNGLSFSPDSETLFTPFWIDISGQMVSCCCFFRIDRREGTHTEGNKSLQVLFYFLAHRHHHHHDNSSSSPLLLAPKPERRDHRQGRGRKKHRSRARAGAPRLAQEGQGRSCFVLRERVFCWIFPFFFREPKVLSRVSRLSIFRPLVAKCKASKEHQCFEEQEKKAPFEKELTSGARGRSESGVQSHDGDGARDPLCLQFLLLLQEVQGPRLFALGLFFCCGGEPSRGAVLVALRLRLKEKKRVSDSDDDDESKRNLASLSLPLSSSFFFQPFLSRHRLLTSRPSSSRRRA